MTIGLKEIEIWQQNYQFDYSCFDSLSSNVELVRLHLKKKGINLSLMEISKVFKNGNLYNKTEAEKSVIIQSCLGVGINDLPINTLVMNYRNTYLGGELTRHLERDSFRVEFKRYFESLTSFLVSSGDFPGLPNIQDVDLELFMIAYSVFCGSYIVKEKGFEDYLGMIGNQKLSSTKLIHIGRNNLNNPLFYDFITSAINIQSRPTLREGVILKKAKNNEKWLDIVSRVAILPYHQEISKIA